MIKSHPRLDLRLCDGISPFSVKQCLLVQSHSLAASIITKARHSPVCAAGRLRSGGAGCVSHTEAVCKAHILTAVTCPITLTHTIYPHATELNCSSHTPHLSPIASSSMCPAAPRRLEPHITSSWWRPAAGRTVWVSFKTLGAMQHMEGTSAVHIAPAPTPILPAHHRPPSRCAPALTRLL